MKRIARRMYLISQTSDREHVKSLIRAFMVRGCLYDSDSESDMDMNSEKRGQTFKSRSSRSETLKSVTPLTDCQRLKETMEKIQAADQAINFFANQIDTRMMFTSNC
ncbi:hypothetical protein TNIN_378111 [Trichonephila inaurata madagascariensis]|uniref:Uncharacterized protein n=1 Tax=Trichonephila inaurata madagascariensis TaxID=2747483 RepID=A0A8X6WYS8_9ARAC|nr:hypothetical protein TNIN_378111 [Trichonephila inaurata madagascariensis]